MKRCSACGAGVALAARYCPACGEAQIDSSPLQTTPPPTAVTSVPGVVAGNQANEGRFLPGAVLAGRYRLVALLGRGGMGEVYRADDLRLGQPVALKFLPDALARDVESRARFYAELRVGRQVAHPNVCRLYDLVELDGHQCLSMEYVDGEDLAGLLHRIGRLPADKAIEIGRDVCAGLAAAHDRGVIHRDLKPANVMVDGQGRARITDFGIAALVDRVEGEAFAGTPAYMAPELFEGAPASVQSDLFALGVLLFEAFTGRRPFAARTPLELKAELQAGPPSFGPLAREVPVDVAAVILNCLAPDPAARPRSALAILATLPGGDPLQRALAAGETPTPAMVAAAAVVGDLSVPRAWSILLAGILGLLGLALLSPHSTLVGRLQPERPPEVMEDVARKLLVDAGLSAAPQDSAQGYYFDPGYMAELRQRDGNPWPQLAAEQPGPLHFFHRQSPQPLLALNVRGNVTSLADVGRVRRDDPPLTLPGMGEVVLDRHGRLLSLRVVPPASDVERGAASVDWSSLLAASGLDPASITAQPVRWTAAVEADERRAWRAHYPGQVDQPLHVEAAALGGAPVWFEVKGPWSRPAPDANMPAFAAPMLSIAGLFGLLMYSIIFVLVARHLRQGRGDRRGALRLALAVFACGAVALLLRSDFVASFADAIGLSINIAAQAAYFALVLWTTWLALEPFVRRRWPLLLVAWSRLLEGRGRDPLLGRDLLCGVAAGIGMMLVVHLETVLPGALGLPNRPPLATGLAALAGTGAVISLALLYAYFAIEMGLAALFLRTLGRSLLRSEHWALLPMAAFFYIPFIAISDSDSLWSLPAALLTIGWMVLLLRLGLLAAVSCAMTLFALRASLPGFEFPVWSAAPGWVAAVLLLIVMLHGFHTALAGKPWLGRRLLGHDDAP
jgi:serine/threonine-protein kinase